MLSVRLAVLGATALALCGSVHAAVPADPSLAPAAALPLAELSVPAAKAPVLHADAVQVAVNTFDAAPAAVRSAAAQGDVPADAASSYLVSATRYVQDVGTFWSPEATAAKTISPVPLPGALWLFGSALLAFLAISVRRKF